MNVNIETHHVTLPKNADANIATRVRGAFSRLTSRISRLNVTLKDINGPRGGRDKVCVLRAELAEGGQVVVINRDIKLLSAVDDCLKRGRLLVSRELKRRRQARRRTAFDRHIAEAAT